MACGSIFELMEAVDSYVPTPERLVDQDFLMPIESKRQQLAREYDRIEDPAAVEIAEWLRGGYRFDPACLTA